jgi:transketolase
MSGPSENGQTSTREAYRDALLELMPGDERLYCLDSDTGLFTGVDFGGAKDRYINVGIAEHNLMGTAAGLADSGALPYVTTMATFATTRALEAIKVDIAYAGLPVRIAGTHAGLAAGHLGPTHHALEDLGIMRMLPGFTVLIPADGEQTASAVRQTADADGPVYLRVGKGPSASLADLAPDREPFTVGRVQRLRGGADLAIFACGPDPVRAALAAAESLADQGISVSVHNVHTLRPLDVDAIVSAASTATAVITVEEHWRQGGLGAAVAETLAEHAPTRVARIGMPDTFVARVGSQQDLLERYGISDTRIVETARHLLTVRPPVPRLVS